ncbi:MAG: transglutaminaseTgpA domain-containing protein [Solirubrobacteraceae bacterium]
MSGDRRPAQPFGERAGGRVRCGPRAARLRVVVARLPAFLALSGFGAHAWVQMVDPVAAGAMVAALLGGLAGGCALIAVAARRADAPARAAAVLLVAGALLLVAFVAAGVPGRLADPRMWADIAAGIGQGLSAVPNVRVPYHGADEWTRIVIVLGCGVLIGLATLLAFAPRRNGVLGFPIAAAIVLATLCLVPAMQREGEHPYLGGAAFALLLALFLWLERVERRTAPMAVAVVVASVLAATIVAPRVDRERPLLDYEQIAQSLSDAPGTRYDWNHDYGPLDWPRNASEVLRIRARSRAYWKAAELTVFDGIRWTQSPRRPAADLGGTPDPEHRDWLQTLRVTVRALSSTQFVGAGAVLGIRNSPRSAVQSAPGVYATRDKPLRRGNSYRAVVYTPRPTARELREAARRPLPAGGDLTSISLPGSAGSAGATTRGARIEVAPWGQGATAQNSVDALQASPYARAYELARRLRAQSATPYDFVLAVERHLSEGYAYSEDPPRSAVPLSDFLFRDRRGYCQQFSGAMALLLRLGGLPARVAAGFAPGVYDSERREYVVRDLDAHSWVEVLFPGIGWVTRDPTPSDSPARAQAADLAAQAPDSPVAIPDSNRAAAPQPAPAVRTDAPAGAAGARDRSPALIAALAVAAALAAVGLLLGARRHRRRRARANADDHGASQLAELRRALRRSGRPPNPQTTLDALAARYRGTAAEGYVRALAADRYGYGGARPTHAQRAALRRELGCGRGLRGRLRAWWALPPSYPRTDGFVRRL